MGCWGSRPAEAAARSASRPATTPFAGAPSAAGNGSVAYDYVVEGEASGGQETALGKAVLANDVTAVRRLLYGSTLPADVNEPVNASGATALILAIYENKSLEVIRELARHPAVDLTRATPQGFFALSFAAEYRDAAVVRELVDAGADVNQQSDASGWTALMRAMRHNRDRAEALEITRLLAVQPAADINLTDASGWTALHHAARYLPAEFSRILVQQGGADVNHGKSDGWTPLMLATGSNECDDVLETVRVLVRAPGIDLERRTVEDDATALMFAASIRDAEMVQLLVQAGADVNAVDRNHWAAIHHALRYNERPLVADLARALLQAPHADPNLPDGEGWSPLMYAARYRGYEEVRVLLMEHRASVRATSAQGSTALSMAVRYSREAARVVQLLLSAEPEHHPSDTVDALGWTPLITAVRYAPDLEVVRLLASADDVPINAAESRSGWTALMVAAKYRDAATARWLLQVPGCDPNRQRDDGITALHIAVAREDGMAAGSFMDPQAAAERRSRLDGARQRQASLGIGGASGEEEEADTVTGKQQQQQQQQQQQSAAAWADAPRLREDAELLRRHQIQLELVEALVAPHEPPLNIDAVERRAGWTALHFAVAYDRTDLILVLLRAGASTTVRTHQGETALEMAARLGFADAAALLEATVDGGGRGEGQEPNQHDDATGGMAAAGKRYAAAAVSNKAPG